jgi:hypothetical protein
MTASSFPFFYVLALSCLSLVALPITRVNAQTALPVLHLSSEQPLDTVQAASPGVKITQIYSGSPVEHLWSVDTPLTLAGGEAECSFSLPVPRMFPGSAILVAPVEIDIVTLFEIGISNRMPAVQTLSTAYQLAAKLQAHGWTPDFYDQPSLARAKRLLRRDFSVSIRDLHCGHFEIWISASSDPRHPKNTTWGFSYHLQPVPRPVP